MQGGGKSGLKKTQTPPTGGIFPDISREKGRHGAHGNHRSPIQNRRLLPPPSISFEGLNRSRTKACFCHPPTPQTLPTPAAAIYRLRWRTRQPTPSAARWNCTARYSAAQKPRAALTYLVERLRNDSPERLDLHHCCPPLLLVKHGTRCHRLGDRLEQQFILSFTPRVPNARAREKDRRL